MNYPERIQQAFNKFNGKNVEVLEDFYSRDIIFEDPVTRIEGLEQLKAYYSHAYKNVVSIKFDFLSWLTEGQRVSGTWKMNLTARGLNRGEPVSVDGVSIMHFDDSGKVIYHRDYLDLGQMIYENLPIQGQVIRMIKKFLK